MTRVFELKSFPKKNPAALSEVASFHTLAHFSQLSRAHAMDATPYTHKHAPPAQQRRNATADSHTAHTPFTQAPSLIPDAVVVVAVADVSNAADGSLARSVRPSVGVCPKLGFDANKPGVEGRSVLSCPDPSVRPNPGHLPSFSATTLQYTVVVHHDELLVQPLSLSLTPLARPWWTTLSTAASSSSRDGRSPSTGRRGRGASRYSSTASSFK